MGTTNAYKGTLYYLTPNFKKLKAEVKELRWKLQLLKYVILQYIRKVYVSIKIWSVSQYNWRVYIWCN